MENQVMAEILVGIQNQLVSMDAKLDKMAASISNLEEDKKEIRNEISSLRRAVNDREQHARNFSVRIFGLSLTQDISADAMKTSKAVFNELIRPILNLAVKDKVLDSVPALLDVIEYSHILPVSSKSEKSAKPASNPIIVRFHSRLLRQLIFKYKKGFLTDSNTKSSLQTVRIVEDLTVANFKKLKELHECKSVEKAWSIGGKLKFTLVNSKNKVHTVNSLEDPLPQ